MITEILQEDIRERILYHEALKAYLGSNVIKVITGMRRVGKSYLLKYCIQDIIRSNYTCENNIFYINKEDLRYDSLRNYQDLYELFQSFLTSADLKKPLFV